MNILKVKASQSFDRFLTGRVIWNQAIKQKALGGTASVHTPKSWTRDTEAIQNKVAKWLMRTGRRASATGLRRELGWTTIRADIAKRKLKWTGKVLEMAEDRWPQITIMEMTEHHRNNPWLREVQLYMKEYNISQEDLRQKNYKAVVDRKINTRERERWVMPQSH